MKPTIKTVWIVWSGEGEEMSQYKTRAKAEQVAEYIGGHVLKYTVEYVKQVDAAR